MILRERMAKHKLARVSAFRYIADKWWALSHLCQEANKRLKAAGIRALRIDFKGIILAREIKIRKEQERIINEVLDGCETVPWSGGDITWQIK